MALSGKEWDQGIAGEQVVREWLKRQGYYVIPVSQIENGGAPVLEFAHSRQILPDILAGIRGSTCWVEVKTKGRATLYRKTGQWEHGVRLSHWFDYLACEDQTGIPGYLCILERENNLILMAAIRDLDGCRRTYYGDAMPDRRPYAFFPRDAFTWNDAPDDLLALLPPPLNPLAPRTLAQGMAPRQVPFKGLSA